MIPLDFPNNIQIQTTAFCNAACSFCPYPETSRELPMGTMDEDLFRTIVDEIARYDIALLQPFLMNDPLMDKNIVSRLAYMREKVPGARINITTNGALLRPRLARELARLDLETIHVSSNGITPETYEKTMGIDGLEVLRNVNRLHDELRRANARTELIVTALFLKATKQEVFVARDYWRSRGVTFYMNPLNDRAGNLDGEGFADMLPFEQEVNNSQTISYDMSGCGALYSFMGVLFNGDLVTCCMDWRRSLVLGNAAEKSLYEVWHDGPYQQIRGLSNEGRLCERELCKKCGENRFSIDQEVLLELLEHQKAVGADSGEYEVAHKLRVAYEQNPDLMKMNLVRPSNP